MIEVEEITFSRGAIGGKEALFATTIYDRQAPVSREYNLGIEIESHRIFGDYIGADGWVDLDDDEARKLADKFGLTEQMIKEAEAVSKKETQEREIENAAYVLQDNHGAPQCGMETLYFESYEDLAGYLDAHLDVNDRITEGYAIVTDGDRYRAAMQKPVAPSQEKRATSVDELAARGREKADMHNKNLKNNDRPNLGKRSR